MLPFRIWTNTESFMHLYQNCGAAHLVFKPQQVLGSKNSEPSCKKSAKNCTLEVWKSVFCHDGKHGECSFV